MSLLCIMRIMVMANSWNMRSSSMGLFQFFKLFNAHIFANSLCSHKHNLLKISAMHYVIYVVIQLEDDTKKWNHVWIRFLLCSQRTLNWIIFFFVWFIQIAAAEKNKIFIEFSYFTGCKGPGCNIRIWYNVKTRLEQSLW